MRGQIQFPDLGKPPEGWTVHRQGHTLRLVPPGAYADGARAWMVISPVIPAIDEMAPLGEVIAKALAAECVQYKSEIQHQKGPDTFETTTGLTGVQFEAELAYATSDRTQKRVYIMCSDGKHIYGIHYIADAGSFAHFYDLFMDVARSVKPISTKATPPA